MKRLGPPTKRYRFNQGLSSRVDTTTLTDGQLQSGARLALVRGLLQKERGTAIYGSVVGGGGGAKGIGIGVFSANNHPHLLVGTSDAIYQDSADDGSTWGNLGTLYGTSADYPTLITFASILGRTYAAGAKSVTKWYDGINSTFTSLPDLPSPDQTPLDYAPEPYDILINDMEDNTQWTALLGTEILSDETSIVRWGAKSVKAILPATAGAGIKRDFTAAGALNLSNTDYLMIWVCSTKAGKNILEWSISENDTTYIKLPITIDESEVNKWKLVVWDLTALSKADRDAIRYMKLLTPTAVSGGVTIYGDHITHSGGLYGQYQYAITFYQSTTGNESPLGAFRTITTSELDAASGVWAARCFYIPSNPVYLPDNTDRIRLYRTKAGGSDFYRIAEITPSSNTWTYTDVTPDADLTEDLRLVQWPGVTPRAQWLIPHGDRLLHVGGSYVASRADCVTTSVNPVNYSTPTFSRKDVPPGEMVAVEMKADTLGVGLNYATLQLQRSAKGANSWSNIGNAFNISPAAASWGASYAYTSNAFSADFSDEYDWRFTCTARGSSQTLYLAWNSLLAASTAASMTNTGDLITTAAPHTLKINDAFTFSASLGGVTAGTTYYVLTTPSTTTFTFSATQGGSTFNVTGDVSSANQSISPLSYLAYRLLVKTPNAVWYSNLGQPDKVPPLDATSAPADATTGALFTINPADGQKIRDWCYHGSDILLFKDRCTYLLTGASPDEVEWIRILPSVGALGQSTAKDCDGIAVWLGNDRQIYAWNESQGLAVLSEPLYEFFDGLTEAQVAGAVAMYWKRRYYLFLPNAAAGNRCRYYDFKEKVWLPGWDTAVYACLPYAADGANTIPYLATATALYQMYGGEGDGVTAITWSARNKDDELIEIYKDPNAEKRLRGYRLLVQGTVSDTISVAWYINRSGTATQTYTETLASASGVQALDRYPHGSIRGKQLSFKLSGSTANALKLVEMQVWLQRAR